MGRGRRGNYPYVTARVKAKRSLLLPKQTYDRIIVMDLTEVARLLGEGQYKDQMNELATKYSGVDLIEIAMSRNLADTYSRIYGYCTGELREMVGAYLERYDLENVKSILRAKLSGAPPEEVIEDLVPAGSFTLAFLRTLVEEPSIDKAAQRLEGTIYSAAFAKLGKRPSEVSELSAWEDEASRLYYAKLLASIALHSDPNRLMARFVETQIDVLNLKTLLRAWTARAQFSREIFVDGGHELSLQDLHEMLGLSREDLLKRLASFAIAKPIIEELAQLADKGVGSILRQVEKTNLLQAERYSHLHPLSVLPVLDYILRKDREVENIRIVARGKESQLAPETIRGLLVI